MEVLSKQCGCRKHHGQRCQKNITMLICNVCRKQFGSQRGLTQHKQRNNRCSRQSSFAAVNQIFKTACGASSDYPKGLLPCLPIKHGLVPANRSAALEPFRENVNDLSEDDVFYVADDDEDEGSESDEDTGRPTDRLRQDFNSYAAKYNMNWELRLDEKTRNAIKLMSILRDKKAPLNACDAVMEWHLKAVGDLHQHERASNSHKYIARQRLIDSLLQRCNMDNGYGMVESIVLPSSKARVDIVKNDVGKMIQSLLTDPRITDDDYLFYDDNPFQPPPERLKYIEDLNTGRAYRETWEQLITNPDKQVLLPCPMHVDAANTGVFANLPIKPLKITLGIWTREARTKGYTWRTLGYVPEITADKSRGRRQLIDSGHCDGTMACHEALRDEGAVQQTKPHKAQDLHAILENILKEFVVIQETGFIWDLYYKGKLYGDVEFIPFVPFVKTDTQEADELCGKYLSRTGNVAQLCRYCECPTQCSDDYRANYRMKTPKKIARLVERKDENGLKAMSQHPIKNAMHALRFGLHNDYGVHSGCPFDMLHHICLGIFKTVRDCFFTQLGKDTRSEQGVDALSRQYAEVICKQSERDLPRFKFSSGIVSGKFMAKEYPGVLMLIMIVLKSDEGRRIVEMKTRFRTQGFIEDWIMLLETLLQWEAWLKQSRLEVSLVTRAETKHRYVMYLIKKVCRRTKGMGLKTTKFHGITHLASDIMNFGVPLEMCTGANEEHHKPAKAAGKLTQRKKETFNQQSALRLKEGHVLEMANQEMEGRPLWNYAQGCHHNAQAPLRLGQRDVGGARFDVCYNSTKRQYYLKRDQKGKKKRKVMIEGCLVSFLGGLWKALEAHIPVLTMHTVHQRQGQIFRGDPSFVGSAWRDWALTDWEGYSVTPNKIWGFVDLSRLPHNLNIACGGLGSVRPSVCAIVESTTTAVRDGDELSQMFVRLQTEVTEMDENGLVARLKFYLADVDATTAPAIVVPNIGGETNEYWWLKGRSGWAKMFADWLKEPHQQDVIDDSDDEESEEEDLNSEVDAQQDDDTVESTAEEDTDSNEEDSEPGSDEDD